MLQVSSQMMNVLVAVGMKRVFAFQITRIGFTECWVAWAHLTCIISEWDEITTIFLGNEVHFCIRADAFQMENFQ